MLPGASPSLALIGWRLTLRYNAEMTDFNTEKFKISVLKSSFTLFVLFFHLRADALSGALGCEFYIPQLRDRKSIYFFCLLEKYILQMFAFSGDIFWNVVKSNLFVHLAYNLENTIFPQ